MTSPDKIEHMTSTTSYICRIQAIRGYKRKAQSTEQRTSFSFHTLKRDKVNDLDTYSIEELDNRTRFTFITSFRSRFKSNISKISNLFFLESTF